MKKKILCLTVLSLFLTSCARNGGSIQNVSTEGEGMIDQQEDTILSAPEESPETEALFDENNYFLECSLLPSPASVSGIEFAGKKNDRYVFSFPDDEKTAGKLYNEYGSLIQSDGFTLEEYEGNYIIKKGEESIAFMGTGHNTEYDYIMMVAFYPEE